MKIAGRGTPIKAGAEPVYELAERFLVAGGCVGEGAVDIGPHEAGLREGSTGEVADIVPRKLTVGAVELRAPEDGGGVGNESEGAGLGNFGADVLAVEAESSIEVALIEEEERVVPGEMGMELRGTAVADKPVSEEGGASSSLAVLVVDMGHGVSGVAILTAKLEGAFRVTAGRFEEEVLDLSEGEGAEEPPIITVVGFETFEELDLLFGAILVTAEADEAIDAGRLREGKGVAGKVFHVLVDEIEGAGRVTFNSRGKDIDVALLARRGTRDEPAGERCFLTGAADLATHLAEAGAGDMREGEAVISFDGRGEERFSTEVASEGAVDGGAVLLGRSGGVRREGVAVAVGVSGSTHCASNRRQPTRSSRYSWRAARARGEKMMVVQRLDDELGAQRARSDEKIPADKQELMEQATRELEAEAWRMGLVVGDVAPDFRLQSVQGETVQLREVLRSRSAILSFYRGQW